MKWVYNIEEPDVENFLPSKIRGYKLLERMRKHVGKDIPPLPKPLAIISPQLIKYERPPHDVVVNVLEVLDDMRSEFNVATFRMASAPFYPHLPNYKLNLRNSDIEEGVKSILIKMMSADILKKRAFSQICIYFHPWIEPMDLRASVEIRVPSTPGELYFIKATYGCGYGLEWLGDKYVVDLRRSKVIQRKIAKKEVYFRVMSPDGAEIHDPPRTFKVPDREVNRPVLADEEIIDLCRRYSPLEKRPPRWKGPVILHWSTYRRDENFTIDFAISSPPKLHLLSGLKLRVVTLSKMSDVKKITNQPDVLYVIKPSVETGNVGELFNLLKFVEKGVIASTGGELSHPALIARERNLPFINIDHDIDLKDGDIVFINVDPRAGTTTITVLKGGEKRA